MVKKFLVIKTGNKDLDYGKGTGVSRKEAQDAFISGFIESAKKKKQTKYKGISGFDFEFY